MNNFKEGRLHSMIKCSVIDNLISEIFEDDIEFEELDYSKKMIVCKMMKDKRFLHGRALA